MEKGKYKACWKIKPSGDPDEYPNIFEREFESLGKALHFCRRLAKDIPDRYLVACHIESVETEKWTWILAR